MRDEGCLAEDSLARHHLRLEDHHRVLRGRNMLRIQLEEARATYLYHFFGHSQGIGSRACLRLAVGRLVGLHTRIRRVMGPAHPMTREITDLLRTALNEQLDWRLDDLDLRMVGHALREFGLDR